MKYEGIGASRPKLEERIRFLRARFDDVEGSDKAEERAVFDEIKWCYNRLEGLRSRTEV